MILALSVDSTQACNELSVQVQPNSLLLGFIPEGAFDVGVEGFVRGIENNPLATLLREGSEKYKDLVCFNEFEAFDIDTWIDELRVETILILTESCE